MLNFLIWVILIYFVLLLIWRYVLPFLLKRYMRRMQQKFSRYTDEKFENEEKKQDGEVRIEHVPDEIKKESSPVDEDDYVDFEEIKENKPDQT
jgi:hypothetical protein